MDSVRALKWGGSTAAAIAVVIALINLFFAEHDVALSPATVHLQGGAGAAAPDPPFGFEAPTAYVLVQFERVPSSRERRALRLRWDLRLLDPIPENSFIARIPTDKWSDIDLALRDGSPSGLVRPLLVRNKRSPRLDQVPAHALSGTDLRLVVQFYPGVPASVQHAALIAAGATDIDTIGRPDAGYWRINLAPADLDALLNAQTVRWVDTIPPPPREDLDDTRVQIQAAALSHDGSGQVIAQFEPCTPSTVHPDLIGKLDNQTPRNWRCSPWVYRELGDSNGYDLSEPIWADTDEDGEGDVCLFPGEAAVAATVVGDPKCPSGVIFTRLPLVLGDTHPPHMFIDNVLDYLEIDLAKPDLPLDIRKKTPSLATLLPRVLHGHATHVAGVLVRKQPADFEGLAKGAKLISFGVSDILDLADSYPLALSQGATVSNNSFGAEHYHELGASTYSKTSKLYDELTAGRKSNGTPAGHGPRIVVVGSVGNAGREWNTARVANTSKNTISVGNLNGDSDIYDGSSRGPTADGRLAPLISAPGTLINSSYPLEDDLELTGTSMSTPMVAAAATLVAEAYKSTCGVHPAPATVRALLLHTATDLTDPLAEGVDLTGPDHITGYGLLNVAAAVGSTTGSKFQTGEVERGYIEYRVLLGGGFAGFSGIDLRVTLAWDDLPASLDAVPGAGLLANDLDLEVVDPHGKRHMPWRIATEMAAGDAPLAAQTSSAAWWMNVPDSKRDRRNTVEQVVVPVHVGGTWKIRVRAHRVYDGPQRYSVVSEALTPASSCAVYPSVAVENPMELPSERFWWALFWIAVAVLIGLTTLIVLAIFEAVSQSERGGYVIALILVLLALFGMLWFTGLSVWSSVMLAVLIGILISLTSGWIQSLLYVLVLALILLLVFNGLFT